MNNINREEYFPADGKLIHSYGKRKDTFSNVEELVPYCGDRNFVIPMFSVPLCHIEVKDWKVKKQKLLNLRKYTQTNEEGNQSDVFDVTTDYHFNNMNGSSYSIDIHMILEDEISLLQDMILHPNDFNNMVYDILPWREESDGWEYFFKLENSWFEKASKSKQHSAHTHGPVGYSCVLFLDYDLEEHSPTVFLNPFFSSFFGCPPDYSPNHIVKEGSLICFPSPIVHYTHPNNSSKDRIILSWNMSVVDKFNNRVFA
jgi:hypothetical protein